MIHTACLYLSEALIFHPAVITPQAVLASLA